MTKFKLKMTEITIIGEIINLELTQADHAKIFVKKSKKLAKKKTKSLKKQLANEQEQVLNLRQQLAFLEHKLKKKKHHWAKRHQIIQYFDKAKHEFDAIKSPTT